nr:sigma-70 family RNA polymerase sigma factor [Chloroflexota bacterium]
MHEPITEDAELVSRIRCGNLDVFEALYHKYKRPLYQTALAITGDQGAAEEILQDCFVRAYMALERVDVSTSLSPWLHRIVINLSANWINRNRPLPLNEWIDRLIAGPVASPEHIMETFELRQVVREAIATLSFTHRAIIVLFYLQGFSLSEIAYIFDCPVGTVKSRLHYACKALRKKLREDRRLAGELVYGTS